MSQQQNRPPSVHSVRERSEDQRRLDPDAAFCVAGTARFVIREEIERQRLELQCEALGLNREQAYAACRTWGTTLEGVMAALRIGWTPASGLSPMQFEVATAVRDCWLPRERGFVARIQADRVSRQGRLRYLVVVPKQGLVPEVWHHIVVALKTAGNPQLLPLSIVGSEARLEGDIIIQLHPGQANIQPIRARQFHGIWFWVGTAAHGRHRCTDRLAPGGWIQQEEDE